MTAASMLLAAKQVARRKTCCALRCLLRLRGAPAIASFLLLLPAARAAASSAASAVQLGQALQDSIAFQNSLSLGPNSGGLVARRGDCVGRNPQHHSCPPLQPEEVTKCVRASPRRASVSLEDSAREEDVFGRASGNGIRENSDDSERRATTRINNNADEDGGSDCGEGGSEGRLVAAAGVPVVMNALEERPPEAAGAFIVPPEDVETEVAGFEFAPAMTVRKFQTMQDRRVPVAIKYSGGGGFKRYFEEIATVLKRHFPDVLIDREIVEVSSTREEKVFEIRVDGKLVCTKRRGKPGVFLHMETFAQAIRKARQRRRPGSIVYGDQETYQNVKALTEERTAGGFLEKDFQDLPDAGDMSSGASQGGGTDLKSGA